MDTNKGLLINRAEQFAKKRGVDNAEIDWKSALDTELTDTENWQIIKEKVRERMDYEDKLDDEGLPHEDEIRAKEREIEEKYIEQIQQEQQQNLQDQFKGEEENEIQEYYKMYNHYVKAIARGHHHAFMVKADPGIGKSYQAQQTLVNEVGEDKFEKISGSVSPFEFYKKLWEKESEGTEVILVDDIEGLLKKNKALGILKQATWSETDDRYVEWNSSPSKLKTKEGQDIPAKFKFTGRLIMIFNDVPEDDIIFQSLKDRCFFYELSFTYEQKAELITELAKKGLDYGIDREKRIDIAKWMCDTTKAGVEGFNLRTFEKALRDYKACQEIDDGITWKDGVKLRLETNENLEVARDIVKSSEFDSVKERKKEFKERTGKSGRTYLRARDRLVENSEEVRKVVESRK